MIVLEVLTYLLTNKIKSAFEAKGLFYEINEIWFHVQHFLY